MTIHTNILAASDLISVLIFLGFVVISAIVNAVKKRSQSRKPTEAEVEGEGEFDLGDLLGDWTAPRKPPPPPKIRSAKPVQKSVTTKPFTANPAAPKPRRPVAPRHPRAEPLARRGVRQVVEVMESALPVVSIASLQSSKPKAVQTKVSDATDSETSPRSSRLPRSSLDLSRRGLRQAVKLSVILGQPRSFQEDAWSFQ